MKALKKFVKKNKKIVYLAAAALVLLIIFIAAQLSYLKWAHSSFENYYQFRGCAQLLQKTDFFGFCKTGSGATIKIVKYQGRWFLDGDLPSSFPSW